MPNTAREKAKIAARSASFHGRRTMPTSPTMLRRPKTETDLLPGRKLAGISSENPPKLTKLLLNVSIQRSLGAIHVVMSSESTVGDLIAAVVKQYVKEERRPFLSSTDPAKFDLHYSSFSLESLDREEKLITLGSRNFFLCPTMTTTTTTTTVTGSSSCSNEAEKDSKIGMPWSRRLLELFN